MFKIQIDRYYKQGKKWVLCDSVIVVDKKPKKLIYYWIDTNENPNLKCKDVVKILK